jgi:ribosomal protein S18 acetylase RimI-like enzyme
MLIRPANAQDIPAMLRLANSSATAAHWSRDQYDRIFRQNAPRRAVWVVEDETEDSPGDGSKENVRGFLAAHEVAGEWEIENIVVDERERRRRLATRLLVELQEVARTEHASAIFLEVRESNHAARAFYQNRGFFETGRRPGYYSQPDEDAITYRLQLT